MEPCTGIFDFSTPPRAPSTGKLSQSDEDRNTALLGRTSKEAALGQWEEGMLLDPENELHWGKESRGPLHTSPASSLAFPDTSPASPRQSVVITEGPTEGAVLRETGKRLFEGESAPILACKQQHGDMDKCRSTTGDTTSHQVIVFQGEELIGAERRGDQMLFSDLPLPEDVMQSVFGRLEAVPDLQSAMLVSRVWKSRVLTHLLNLDLSRHPCLSLRQLASAVLRMPNLQGLTLPYWLPSSDREGDPLLIALAQGCPSLTSLHVDVSDPFADAPFTCSTSALQALLTNCRQMACLTLGTCDPCGMPEAFTCRPGPALWPRAEPTTVPQGGESTPNGTPGKKDSPPEQGGRGVPMEVDGPLNSSTAGNVTAEEGTQVWGEWQKRRETGKALGNGSVLLSASSSGESTSGPAPHQHWPQLRYLDLHHCCLPLPSDVAPGSLSSLRHLGLRGCLFPEHFQGAVTATFELAAKATGLTSLVIDHGLGYIGWDEAYPTEDVKAQMVRQLAVLAPLGTLRHLSLARIHLLDRLPDCFQVCLRELRSLSLDSLYQFRDLASVCQLTALTSLFICNLPILELPQSMAQMSKLQCLTVTQCDGIEEIPAWFGELQSLKELSFRDLNYVTALPDSLGCLVSLRVLDLGLCFRLRELPHTLKGLRALEYVDVAQCEAQGVVELQSALRHLRVRRDEFSCSLEVRREGGSVGGRGRVEEEAVSGNQRDGRDVVMFDDGENKSDLPKEGLSCQVSVGSQERI